MVRGVDAKNPHTSGGRISRANNFVNTARAINNSKFVEYHREKRVAAAQKELRAREDAAANGRLSDHEAAMLEAKLKREAKAAKAAAFRAQAELAALALDSEATNETGALSHGPSDPSCKAGRGSTPSMTRGHVSGGTDAPVCKSRGPSHHSSAVPGYAKASKRSVPTVVVSRQPRPAQPQPLSADALASLIRQPKRATNRSIPATGGAGYREGRPARQCIRFSGVLARLSAASNPTSERG